MTERSASKRRRPSGDPFAAIVETFATAPRRRRGRPRRLDDTPVRRSPIALLRAMWVLWHFEEARSAGLGHTAAVAASVRSVKRSMPGARVSRAEVERVLAEFQPVEGDDPVWRVRIVDGRLSAYLGPRIRPRIKLR